MTCFMALGWKFPDAHLRSAHRLSGGEQHPAALQSGRGAQAAAQAPVRRLPRLRHRGLGAHRQGNDREGHRRRSLARLRPRGRLRILRRGRAAVGGAAAPAIAGPVAVSHRPASTHVLHWSNYSAKAIAQIQARGMPIDMPLWNLVQENKAAVIGELLRAVRSELRQRRSDLHAGRRVELRAVRALARRASA